MIAAVERGLREAKSPDDVSSLLETFYVLYPPQDAEEFYEALEQAEQGNLVPRSFDEMQREFGFLSRSAHH